MANEHATFDWHETAAAGLPTWATVRGPLAAAGPADDPEEEEDEDDDEEEDEDDEDEADQEDEDEIDDEDIDEDEDARPV